ncbi:MAG: pyroglutamyl-peptidase I [Planctomycetota bacterium]
MSGAGPRILVTSFEPFGGSPVNPTMRIAELLRGAPSQGASLSFATLPVVTGTADGSAWSALLPLIERNRPAAVVSLGESAKAERINLERVAVNLRDARIADNTGVQLRDLPVVEGAPDAYFATLPVRAMLEACASAGVAAELSLSAGAFLCNETMFRTLHHAAARRLPLRAGFIHVPQLPEQAAARGGPSMDADTAARGVRAALEALAFACAETAA